MILNIFKRSKNERTGRRDKLQINGQTLVFNSRGLIPAIIQRIKQKNKEVIDLVYMNIEAFDLSIKFRKVYVFRRSKQQVELLGKESENGFQIKSIKLSKNHRSLLITVSADKKLSERQAFITEILD